MPMLLIEGTYGVVGARPDGDSVRFTPGDPAQWDLVEGPHRGRRNSTGGAQLRLDGIITSSAPERTPGFILTRGADIHGRCVALAGRGADPGTSGAPLHVDVALLGETANFRRLSQGVAYPTYYTKLFFELREAMTEAVNAARATRSGLWPADVTTTGAKIDGLAAITDNAVLVPKLFRRLADYLALGAGDPSLAGFRDYLDQRDDRVLVLSTGQFTGLSTLVDINDQVIAMTRPPEDLVFQEA
ncbi:hypothetical protein ACGFNU_39895 [Spirillospora sp. NPDC048911]|uniref:hypothetical protein n=1 Tax=Spirillospora sp. NPDC048911 TaxID=3364527 RepID=UPI003723B25C